MLLIHYENDRDCVSAHDDHRDDHANVHDRYDCSALNSHYVIHANDHGHHASVHARHENARGHVERHKFQLSSRVNRAQIQQTNVRVLPTIFFFFSKIIIRTILCQNGRYS